jgi:hypothetical protein
VRVADLISCERLLAANFTNLCHDRAPITSSGGISPERPLAVERSTSSPKISEIYPLIIPEPLLFRRAGFPPTVAVAG